MIIYMPANFVHCVKVVKKKSPNVNPWAVCRVSTGFYGSTKHKFKGGVKKNENKEKDEF